MLIERKEYKEENGDIGYIESIFKSSNILKTIYFPRDNRLYIAFSRGGQIYSYSNITSEIYNEFENSESHGKFFHSKINKNPSFPYRKEYTLLPSELSEAKKIIEENLNDEDDA
jgi:hypothetical protein